VLRVRLGRGVLGLGLGDDHLLDDVVCVEGKSKSVVEMLLLLIVDGVDDDENKNKKFYVDVDDVVYD
jgi:hypothetical protein